MSAYIMDVTCFSYFPTMGSKWKSSKPLPIHIYHSKFWEENYGDHFYPIYHFVIIPIYEKLFHSKPLWISEEAKIGIAPIGNWYFEEKFSYMRIYNFQGALHALPHCVLDRLIRKKIVYHTVNISISYDLYKNSKKIWPSFLIWIGVYTLEKVAHAKKELLTSSVIKLAKIT